MTFLNDALTRLTQSRTYDALHRLTGVTSQNGATLSASGYPTCYFLLRRHCQ